MERIKTYPSFKIAGMPTDTKNLYLALLQIYLTEYLYLSLPHKLVKAKPGYVTIFQL